MPKRGRDDGISAEQQAATAAATDEYGREVAVHAQPSSAGSQSAAAAEWHVDYRKPLRRWASQVLPRCENARSCAEDDNFVKGVKWSPDGLSLIHI